MTDLRTREKNNVTKQMQELDRQIEYNEKRSSRIIVSNFDDQYIKNSVTKSDEKIKSLRDQKVRLMKRYSDICAGLLDYEIKEEYRKRSLDIESAGREKINKRLSNSRQDSQILQKEKKHSRTVRKDDNTYKYTMENEFRKFQTNSNKTPQFIIREINRLPNNRGFIWRGIHYYGILEDDGGNTILKEPMKGFSYIHETDRATGEKITYKSEKGRKIRLN